MIAPGQGEKDCIFRRKKSVFTVFALIFALPFMQNLVTATESNDVQKSEKEVKKNLRRNAVAKGGQASCAWI